MANRRSPPNSSTATRAVGYIRRSTDRQEQSIPDQKKAIEEYARQQGIQVVRSFVDDAVSGTSTLRRKAFQAMIAEAQKPGRGWEAIIVYDVKRFGRTDNDEAGYYRHILRKHGVQIHYVTENFNGDGTDDLLRPVKQWQARQESKDLSKVTIRGLVSRSGKGWWMGGVPPIGYDLQYENERGEFLFVLRHLPDRTKRLLDEKGKVTRTLSNRETLSISKQDHACLVPGDPERVQVVCDIFRMYVNEGKGFKAIADTLNRKGTAAVRGPEWARIYSGKWADSTVRAILMNRAYTGDMIWNRRTDARFYKISQGRAVERDGVHEARLVPNDESEWIVVPDSHEAIIRRALFEKARQRREARVGSRAQRGQTPVGGWQGVRSRFILSGLLVCERCGRKYQGRTAWKGKLRIDGSRLKTFYYICGGRVRNGKTTCDASYVRQADLEDAVIRALVEHYKSFLGVEGAAKLKSAVKEMSGSHETVLDETRMRLLDKQEQLEGQVRNLLDNLTPKNRDFVDERLEQLRKERDEIRISLEQLETLTETRTAVGDTDREAREFLQGIEFALTEGVPEEKRVVLRRCVDRIVITPDSRSLTLHVFKVPTGGTRHPRAEGIRRLVSMTSSGTMMDVSSINGRSVMIQRQPVSANIADLDRGTSGGVALSPNKQRPCGVVPQSRPNGVVAGAP
ncbi:MAG: recombinase family protein [Planctomycetota bacterium]|nr:recombinase family protein [Planctomycetota bacterium]